MLFPHTSYRYSINPLLLSHEKFSSNPDEKAESAPPWLGGTNQSCPRPGTPLPGWEAQIKAARALEHRDWRMAPNPYKCGLMLLLYPSQDELCTAFIKRPAYNDYFSKHVSFPGGGSGKSDENIIQTALRETKEELGVDPEAVTVLGQLSPLGFPP
ncbi:MAG: NUDIX domain-containing protein, partial [Bacteroidetes bacterium]